MVGRRDRISFAVDIAMSGGTLTFDMTDDIVDSVTLTGGTINLGGGRLVVSDADVKTAIASTGITTSATDALTITLTDATVAATDLSGLNGKTAVAVNAASVGTVTGSVAELQAAYVAGVSGLGDEAITVTGAAITVADANIVAGLTTGVVTATIDATTLLDTGGAADLVDLVESGHALSVTVAAADAVLTAGMLQALLAVDGKTTVAVNASAVTSVTGSYAEVSALYAAGEAGTITGLGNETVAVTGSLTVSEANTIASKTTGVVTASLASTTLAEYAALTETGNIYTISIADTAIDAAALRALDAKTTGTITLTGVGQTITGTLSDVNAVLGTAGRELTAAVVVTDSISAAEAETLAGLTTGIVTATIDAGAAGTINAALVTNAAATDALTITIP